MRLRCEVMGLTGLTGSGGAHDFDFFYGSWHIDNERLRTRLRGADDWERFGADCMCWPILGGVGNVDEFRPDWPGHEGFKGASVRIFDPTTATWSIYWADNVRCALFPPVVGAFHDGVGEFFGDDVEGDTPVRVRYCWSGITPTAVRWEQAFSPDGGETWESNWVMNFSRSSEEPRRAQEGVSR
jgi:hypothetical protein